MECVKLRSRIFLKKSLDICKFQFERVRLKRASGFDIDVNIDVKTRSSYKLRGRVHGAPSKIWRPLGDFFGVAPPLSLRLADVTDTLRCRGVCLSPSGAAAGRAADGIYYYQSQAGGAGAAARAGGPHRAFACQAATAAGGR